MHRVVIIGMGAIGYACARAIRAESNLKLAGMVDTDADKIGKSLFDLGWDPGPGTLQAPRNEDPGPTITNSLDEAMKDGADVAIVATSSHFDAVVPIVKELLSRGVSIVSSCEEMIYPWYRHAALADDVDAAAKAAGRAVLGCGVNPGFVMDKLPVVLSTMVRRVDSVTCVRRVDAALRRRALQIKVGAGLTTQEFTDLRNSGRIGHVGLIESLALLASGLGRRAEPGSVSETLEPVICEAPINSAVGLIQPGEVAGIHQVATWKCDDLSLCLDLTMAVGIENTKDTIQLGGPVQLYMKIPGSVPGDSATVAGLVNHIHVVHEAEAGLRTVLDVPTAGCRNRPALAANVD